MLVSGYAATPPVRLFEDQQQRSGTPPVTPLHTSANRQILEKQRKQVPMRILHNPTL